MSASIHRRTMTWSRMVVAGVSLAGLMIILFGGIPTAYQGSGNSAVPLAFLIVGGILGLAAVGYLAMAARHRHPAPFYAVAAHGLGKPVGVAAGMLALTGYNSILTCIYAFIGGTVATAVGVPWWVGAAVAWLLIAWLGSQPVSVYAWALGVVLALSVLVSVLFVIAAVGHPAGGHVTFDGYSWRLLTAGSIAVVLVLCVASEMGPEGTASYALEAVDRPGARPGSAVRSATLWAFGLLTVGCSVLAWAMGVYSGVPGVVAATQHSKAGLPFDVMQAQYGDSGLILSWAVLILGVLATVLSLHAVVARYGYAMAREGVLWAPIASVGRGRQAGVFVGGARLQSAISAVLILGFAVTRADPLTVMFPSLATLGAVSLVVSLIVASTAALAGLRESDETVGVRVLAPASGVLGCCWLAAEMVLHGSVLLHPAPGSFEPVIIPAVIGAVLVGGLIWARVLSARRPAVYALIGGGTSRPLQFIPGQLEGVEL